MKYIILLLFSNCCYANMEQTIYKAVMSYETPRIYKRNTESYINRQIGQHTVTTLSVSFRLLYSEKILIPIKHKNERYFLNIKKDSVFLEFTKDF